MDFNNFYNPYILDVKESVLGSFAQPCLGDLENLGQLPVLQELEGTDNLVLCIFVISSLPTFRWHICFKPISPTACSEYPCTRCVPKVSL